MRLDKAILAGYIFQLIYSQTLLHLAYFFASTVPLGNIAHSGMESLVDGKQVSPENTDYSVCLMQPPTKRSKLYGFFGLNEMCCF